MKTEIIFTHNDWDYSKSKLTSDGDDESAMILFCREVKTANLRRYLVVDAMTPEIDDLPVRNPGYVKLAPEFMEKCFQKCETEGLHLIDCHTHPFTDQPTFSSIDDDQDAGVKGPYFDTYLSEIELLFIVCGRNPDRLDARMWDKQSHSLKQIDLVKII